MKIDVLCARNETDRQIIHNKLEGISDSIQEQCNQSDSKIFGSMLEKICASTSDSARAHIESEVHLVFDNNTLTVNHYPILVFENKNPDMFTEAMQTVVSSLFFAHVKSVLNMAA